MSLETTGEAPALIRALLADACAALGAAAGAVVSHDPEYGWRVVVATSDDDARAVAVPGELAAHPVLESVHTRAPVAVDDLDAAGERWPEFAAAARRAGYRSACALPLRREAHRLGTLLLFGQVPLTAASGPAAGRVADLVSVALLQDAALRQASVLAAQLQHALTSRVVIEQAKGILAERGKLPMDQAFAQLRAHARSTNTRLSALAQAVVDGTTDVDRILARQLRPRRGHALPAQRGVRPVPPTYGQRGAG